jgi:thiamine-monophosphate kinase
MPEFDLIARIRQRAAGRDDVVLGIGDDAALLAPPAGQWLVAAQDTLNIGVHFPPDTAPDAIGWKALAVNLSDLAAMGAEPAWCLLSLSLPAADAGWLDGFLDGFLALAAEHGVALVGGDTTRGPLSISVAIHGFVPAGTALRRVGATGGDDVWVTGTLGDAAAALPLGGDAPSALRERLDRPRPRLAAGRVLRGLASACIDVSDGLLADLGHLLEAGGVGAELEADALPTSAALIARFDAEARWALQLGGGDDYELCFTAPAAKRTAVAAALAAADTPVARIGRIVAGHGCRVRAAGRDWTPAARGYQHFGAGSA